MSASRTSFLRKRRCDIFPNDEESEDEDVEYTETEKRERFLEKVEQGARLIRAFNLLAEPMMEELWGEEKYKILSTPVIVSNDPPLLTKSILSSPSVSSKENKPNKQQKKRVSFTPQKRIQPPVSLEQSEDNSSSVHNSSRSSSYSWSPVKHVKSVNSLSPLKVETTPSWKPLRKSKARESLVCRLDISLLDSPSTGNDSCRSVSKSHHETEHSVSSVEPHGKPISFTEPRSPLKRVEVENETPRKRTNCYNDGSPALKKVFSCPLTSQSENVVPDDEAVSKLSIRLKKKSSSKQSSSEKLVNENSSDESSNTVEADPEVPSTSKTPISHLQNMRSPVRYSPILKKAYGEQSARIHGSIVSPEKVVNPDCIPEGIDPKAVLKDVVAYVEVRRGEDDRTSGFRWKLKQLGATLVDSLIKKATHVVFQEGLLSTFRKAKSMKVHLVSALWVMACDESLSHVPEEQYPIENLEKYDLMDPLTKYIRRPKIMTPDLGSGRDEKRLSRRFKSIQRRSVSVASSPVVTEKGMADITSFVDPELKPKNLQYCSNSSNMGGNNNASQGDGDKNVASEDNEGKHVTSQDDDDWDDGFLAMLEAKVRAKTAKLHAEQLAEIEKNFKKQLQELLGKPEDKTDQPVALAPIFTSGKTSSGPSNKSQDRSKVRIKANINSSASSSLMMSWLKKKTTGGYQPKSSEEINIAPKGFSAMKEREITATAAADALSDEIIKSIMSKKTSRSDDSVSSRCISNPVIPTTSGTIARKESCNEEIYSEITSALSESPTSMNLTKPTLSLDIQKKDLKSSVKRSGKKSQVKRGSEASSSMMMSWLGNKQKSGPVLNAADSYAPDPKSVDRVQNSTSLNGKITPVKCVPNTPRRRSARLTPVKVLSSPGKPSVLKTVLEGSEKEISKETNDISEGAIKRTSILKAQTPQKRQVKTLPKDKSCKRMPHATVVLSSEQITLSDVKGSPDAACDDEDVKPYINRQDSGLGEEEESAM